MKNKFVQSIVCITISISLVACAKSVSNEEMEVVLEEENSKYETAIEEIKENEAKQDRELNIQEDDGIDESISADEVLEEDSAEDEKETSPIEPSVCNTVETETTNKLSDSVMNNSSVENTNETSTTENAISETDASGEIVFVHECTTWETVSQKISDAYTYQELVQKGYNCGVCNVVFDTYSDICPSCESTCINNNYILEDRVAPATYLEYEICTFCGNTANTRTVQK